MARKRSRRLSRRLHHLQLLYKTNPLLVRRCSPRRLGHISKFYALVRMRSLWRLCERRFLLDTMRYLLSACVAWCLLSLSAGGLVFPFNWLVHSTAPLFNPPAPLPALLGVVPLTGGQILPSIIVSLLAMKGAFIIGYLIYEAADYKDVKEFRFPRSVSDHETLLMSTVSQLDQNNCILKLLCQLQTKTAETRTPQENVIVDLFSYHLDAFAHVANASVFSPVHEVESNALDVGMCDSYFSKCPFAEEHLRALLQYVWSCGPPTL
ncbi:hypothetical protein C7M84_023791 [Penaeus vannamei]|uniref:Uncharacterized protein n=1 Tax=Penaeus vannamei TaxID=6689 RepID=A0A423U2X7_PENVA|nr:uncharacterized protein LOC113800074 [Penaeus vannamei]ROT83034.1 hypothetical protein C7M84_023791 [Penaeus vannamei]